MPPVTRFVDGSGPIFAGKLFPFCFITIACGAVSGFHALIASGTTPKMLARECHARLIGYGSMLTEPGRIMASSRLPPSIPAFFRHKRRPAPSWRQRPKCRRQDHRVGIRPHPDQMATLADRWVEATLLYTNRRSTIPGVGDGGILGSVYSGADEPFGFWYHFAILFEAVFI